MVRYLLFVCAVCLTAVWYGSDSLSGSHAPGAGASDVPKRAASKQTRKAEKPRRMAARSTQPKQISRGRKVRLKQGRGGHYFADVRVNGRKLSMVVDTGATSIALTSKDAKRLGVYPRADKFIYKTRTANGITKVAVVTLKEVKIGGIRVKNVEATVHKGKGLSINLLGMSFLNRLRKFYFEGDTMTMVN
ncbi:MAG: TIGR02281 family clan AA aspartic protease [Pseudomonadota bacterium]